MFLADIMNEEYLGKTFSAVSGSNKNLSNKLRERLRGQYLKIGKVLNNYPRNFRKWNFSQSKS